MAASSLRDNNSTAYQAPILIGANSKAQVDSNYQQFFDQYTTTNIPLFDKKHEGDGHDLPRAGSASMITRTVS